MAEPCGANTEVIVFAGSGEEEETNVGIGMIYVIIRASSIPRHADFHAAPQNSLLAAEFAASCGKTPNCPFCYICI